MKTLYLALITLALASCKKDDDCPLPEAPTPVDVVLHLEVKEGTVADPKGNNIDLVLTHQKAVGATTVFLNPENGLLDTVITLRENESLKLAAEPVQGEYLVGASFVSTRTQAQAQGEVAKNKPLVLHVSY